MGACKRRVELINVSTKQDKRELKIKMLILQEYADVFAWSYANMSSLHTEIMVHKLPLMEGCIPIKQKLRRTSLDILIQVKEEVRKQFLEVVNYLQ